MHTTATYPFTAVAVDPIHHGAGTAGNTALLRTQEIVLPDGTQTVVPFISGNSLRHRIRAAAARHALSTMQVAPRSLPKGVVDLLFSGGALTKSGANVDLDTPRQVADLYPALTLLGYSAGSSMVAGKLRVDNLHLVCRENTWRMPPTLAGTPAAQLRAGAFRGEEFGTRHDVARTPDGAHYTSLLAAVEDKAPDTTQMIYDFQVIKPGAMFAGALHVEGATDAEVAALRTALHAATTVTDQGRVITLGAKAGVGFGRATFVLPDAFTVDADPWYEALLRDNADTIVELWSRLVA